jgi:hypothetical protein
MIAVPSQTIMLDQGNVFLSARICITAEGCKLVFYDIPSCENVRDSTCKYLCISNFALMSLRELERTQ